MLPLPVGSLLASTLRRFGVSASVTHYTTPGTLADDLSVSGQTKRTATTSVLEAGIDDIKDLGYEGEIHINDRAFTLPADWAGAGTSVRLTHRDTIVTGGLTFTVIAPAHAVQAGGGQVGAWIVIGRVGGAGGVASLGFTVQPTDPAGGAITPAVQVAVQDDSGATITAPVASVRLAITPGTGAPNAVLGGTLTRPTVNGVAMFADLTIDLAGTGYTLTATAAGLVDGVSAPFDVTTGP